MLEYCPRPSKPLTTTLKHYSIPIITAITSVAIFTTVSYFLLSGTSTQITTPQKIPPPPPPLELPKVDLNYLPGVSVGDYVLYGEYLCNFSHPTGPEWDMRVCMCAMDWKKVEVIGVSGKEVTLRYTEQLKNGSATDHSGCVHVIEDIEHPARINGSCMYSGYYFGDTVVVANLTEGDWIHSSGPCGMPMHQVNRTEIRTYLGVNRWVNIMKYLSGPSQTNLVFDMKSGILLEYEVIGPNNERSSHRVIETNIFSPP